MIGDKVECTVWCDIVMFCNIEYITLHEYTVHKLKLDISYIYIYIYIYFFFQEFILS